MLAALLLCVTAERADGRAGRTTARCCFEFSLQVDGIETVDYGDGTGSFQFFRGDYSAHWQFAFRVLTQLERIGGHYELDRVGHHDWVVEWAFEDTPQGVEAACCYTQTPHGWKPACAVPNAQLGSNGLTDERRAVPRFGFSGSRLAVSVDRPTTRADFQCGLNDGRLDAVWPGNLMWSSNQLKRPSTKRLLQGADFAQTCVEAATFGPDPGISVVGSNGTEEVRGRFRHFAKSGLLAAEKRLDALVGSHAPGVNGPPSEPNAGDRCHPG